jgi:hypothetical protein
LLLELFPSCRYGFLQWMIGGIYQDSGDALGQLDQVPCTSGLFHKSGKRENVRIRDLVKSWYTQNSSTLSDCKHRKLGARWQWQSTASAIQKELLPTI